MRQPAAIFSTKEILARAHVFTVFGFRLAALRFGRHSRASVQPMLINAHTCAVFLRLILPRIRCTDHTCFHHGVLTKECIVSPVCCQESRKFNFFMGGFVLTHASTSQIL